MSEGAEIAYARLVSLHDDVTPAEIVLSAAEHTIGRAPGCDIVVPRSTISRLHAKVVREGPRYLLHDAGSANGTFINGQPLAGPHLLSNRDTIGLGAAGDMLRFVDPDPTVVPASRLRLDERTQTFYLGAQVLSLPPGQQRLLTYLYRRPGELCTREECARAIWGHAFDPGLDADALDKAVSGLRAALRKADPSADLIQTRRSMGFVLLPASA
jgi:pSer/pThr/pTyr-binding forkhead associated (FHA) protein